MASIREPARDVPVAAEVDLCVVGGSCTGVFAAIAAARMGFKTAIIEAQGLFGGTATAGLVSVWHTLMDSRKEKRIIGGLTLEIVERLARRGGIAHQGWNADFVVNTAELAIALDALVREAGVRPFLHARFVAPVQSEGRLTHAILEDKSGRRAVAARLFIDATGDGDVLARAGLPFTLREDLQPPTTCCHLAGLREMAKHYDKFYWAKAVYSPCHGEDLSFRYGWSTAVAGAPELEMVAGTRVSHANCADADELTAASMEARRQVGVIVDRLRTYRGGNHVALVAIGSHIGIRESRHAQCLYQLTEQDCLLGRRFDDAIANGTYPLDIHHSNKPGITLRLLDGREIYHAPEQQPVVTRWRPEGEDFARFYQIPYRCLVPKGSKNLLVAGRLLDTDRGAYGGVRVMVNCNQTGQAAGVAAALAMQAGTDVSAVDAAKLRKSLADQGAIVL